MDKLQDVTVHIPAEHLDALSEVIRTGLLRAKISQEARRNLASWWAAEEEMIYDDLAVSQATPEDL